MNLELTADKQFNAITSNDIRPYKLLPNEHKNLARKRAMRVLQSMRVGYVETSILPTYLIVELWNNEVFYKDRNNFKLVTKTSFDGGTNFYVENKS